MIINTNECQQVVDGKVSFYPLKKSFLEVLTSNIFFYIDFFTFFFQRA